MNLGNRRFRPAGWSILVTACGVALFVSLGMWQLERAAFKDAVQAKFEQRLAEDYAPLGGEPGLDDVQYRKLRLRGEYETRHHFLLDNITFDGKAGYQVLTPLYLADSDHIILVNRGWAAWNGAREPLPLPSPPAVAGEVIGIAFVPSEPALALGEFPAGGSWPRLIPYVDIEALRQQYSSKLLPMILWMAPEHPGDYVRAWDPIWLPPEKSRAYAVQWFAFAAIATLLFFVLNLRKEND